MELGFGRTLAHPVGGVREAAAEAPAVLLAEDGGQTGQEPRASLPPACTQPAPPTEISHIITFHLITYYHYPDHIQNKWNNNK